MSNFDDIRISVIGGPGDGKTTFISSMIISMVYDMVSLNEHSIHLEPLEMNKGFTVEEKKGSGTIEQKDVETVDKTSLSSMMSSLQAAVPTPRRRSSNDENGTIEAKDVSGALQLQQQLKNLFAFKRSGAATSATSTGRYITMKYDVQLDGNSICTLTVVDYAGEIVALEAGRDPNELLLASFSQQIKDCNAAVILANAVKLKENLNKPYDPQNVDMFNRAKLMEELSVHNITAAIKVAKANSPFCFLVDISQSQHPAVLNSRVPLNNFKGSQRALQERIFNVLYSQAPNKWAVGMLPIDAFGRNCVDENNQLKKDADFAPIGIDKSILFCLYNVSQYYDKMIQDEINSIHVSVFDSKKVKADAKKKKDALIAQRKKYAELRTAIKSDEHYFEDVYEKNHDEHRTDLRFPFNITADVIGVV